MAMKSTAGYHRQIHYGKLSVCQWFVRVVACTEKTVWDREMNLGVHHNVEWKDLNCTQKWILFAVFWSDRIKRMKEQISECHKHVQAYGGECCDRWYQMQCLDPGEWEETLDHHHWQWGGRSGLKVAQFQWSDERSKLTEMEAKVRLCSDGQVTDTWQPSPTT